ncbi:unnamed protein product [uncultured bacterium]|nr:unnamed protein product [uncultured bacterium]
MPKNPKQKPAVAFDTRPRLERIIQIHEAIQSGKRPNCPALQEILLGISRWTVLRDIEFMRDRLCLPIECEKGKLGGYFYSHEVTTLPLIQISEGELVALCVARQALESYRGTSFEPLLRAAFEKLSAGLGQTVEFNFAELSSVISFRAAGFSPIADLETFDKVSRAAIRQEEIELEYHKPNSDEPVKLRILRPHHLTSVGGAWYTFATAPERNTIRTYAIGRMRKVNLTGRKFERLEGFDPATYLANSFGIFGGEAPEKIRLRFTKTAATWIEERLWHASQKLTRKKSGELDVEFHVCIAPDLERWILGWGSEVEVLGPAKLRRKIAETGEKVSRING